MRYVVNMHCNTVPVLSCWLIVFEILFRHRSLFDKRCDYGILKGLNKHYFGEMTGLTIDGRRMSIHFITRNACCQAQRSLF